MKTCKCTQGRLLLTAFVIFCLSLYSVPAFAACPSADLTGDCFVNFKDIDALAAQWLSGTPSDCATSDLTGDCYVDFEDFAVLAGQWLEEGTPEPDITWVSISDPGVSGYEGFNGQMSKYETTNAQYCQFLNAAIASGDITVSGDTVNGAKGSNGGADFVNLPYYNLAGTGYGVDAKINYSGGVFTVDSGFENHPVNYVSWYGATAFCNYYGYRLPTQWEWQAVADYTGTYTYGCGTTITPTTANYTLSSHPYGTTTVGAFGAYGYGMCDMSGNVWEWTSSIFSQEYYYRGGGWNSTATFCKVLFVASYYTSPDIQASSLGFRVCR